MTLPGGIDPSSIVTLPISLWSGNQFLWWLSQKMIISKKKWLPQGWELTLSFICLKIVSYNSTDIQDNVLEINKWWIFILRSPWGIWECWDDFFILCLHQNSSSDGHVVYSFRSYDSRQNQSPHKKHNLQGQLFHHWEENTT